MLYREETSTGTVTIYRRPASFMITLDTPGVIEISEQIVSLLPGDITDHQPSDILSHTCNVAGLLKHIPVLDEDEDPTAEYFTVAEFMLMARAIYLALARERDA